MQSKKGLVKKTESFSYGRGNKITFGAIGEGTARKFCERVVDPLSNRCFLQREKQKMLYLDGEASGRKWVEKFSKKIRSGFVIVVEGKENSTSLVQSIKRHSSRVLSFRIYKRKNLMDETTSLLLANKVSSLTKEVPGTMSGNQPVGILVSSTASINKVGGVIERLCKTQRLIIISHHDKILSQVKKNHGRISCVKVKSLNPANISEEIEYLL